MFNYRVTLAPDDDTVLVTFADVPEAITFGVNEQEALMQAVDALEIGLWFYADARQPLPVPSKAKRGQKTVSPSSLECAKLGVYKAMPDQGMRKAELAHRLSWHMPRVDRVFDLRHVPKFEQFGSAAAVLGKRLVLSVK